MGTWRASALLVAFAAAGCALDRSGLMELAPDAASGSGDDAGGGAGVEAGPPPDAGGQVGDAAGQDADASSAKDASSGSNDGSVTTTDAGNANDAPATGYPTSCSQAGAASGDQDVTLYVGGDPSKPWTAHCSGGNAYLKLGSSNSNFSSYPGGGCAAKAKGPNTVKTTWTMLRIDPATLVVDTSDYAGATSSGDTHEVSGNGSYVVDYTAMPFASGRSCSDQDPSTSTAGVDLSGTSFAVANAQPWYLLGWSNSNGSNKPFGGASPASGKTLSLSVGGYPAGITPCQNDFYQTTGGPCLQLVYSP